MYRKGYNFRLLLKSSNNQSLNPRQENRNMNEQRDWRHRSLYATKQQEIELRRRSQHADVCQFRKSDLVACRVLKRENSTVS